METNMNAEEIIKLNKEALYSSLTSSDIFGKFFNKSILHYAAIMEVFSFNKLGGISYEKLCHSIPKSLGSRSSIQNLLNEGLDKNLLVKVESEKDKRIKNYFLSDDFYHMVLDWIKAQKRIYNS
jgi:hypothetical protein|tara:strand:- start:888 stop:1259 length:372 start_codon:yes stop_codon:yes gene_type:complete